MIASFTFPLKFQKYYFMANIPLHTQMNSVLELLMLSFWNVSLHTLKYECIQFGVVPLFMNLFIGKLRIA